MQEDQILLERRHAMLEGKGLKWDSFLHTNEPREGIWRLKNEKQSPVMKRQLTEHIYSLFEKVWFQ